MREIKNDKGKVIGRIHERGEHQKIYDATGKRLGCYNAETGETKDANGRVVNRGSGTLTNFLKS